MAPWLLLGLEGFLFLRDSCQLLMFWENAFFVFQLQYVFTNMTELSLFFFQFKKYFTLFSYSIWQENSSLLPRPDHSIDDILKSLKW